MAGLARLGVARAVAGRTRPRSLPEDRVRRAVRPRARHDAPPHRKGRHLTSAGDPRFFTTGNFTLLGIVLLLPAAVGAAADLTVTVTGLAWAVVMGAGTTAFAYVAWYGCQRRLSSSQSGLVQLATPVQTAVGAVALLGEPLTARLGIAAGLVAAGMWLGQAVPSRPSVVASPRTTQQ